MANFDQSLMALAEQHRSLRTWFQRPTTLKTQLALINLKTLFNLPVNSKIDVIKFNFPSFYFLFNKSFLN